MVGWGKNCSNNESKFVVGKDPFDLRRPSSLKESLMEVRGIGRENFVKISLTVPKIVGFFKISIKEIIIFSSISAFVIRKKDKHNTKNAKVKRSFLKFISPHVKISLFEIYLSSPKYSQQPLKGCLTNFISISVNEFDTTKEGFNLVCKEVTLECGPDDNIFFIRKMGIPIIKSKFTFKENNTIFIDNPTITLKLTTLLLIKQLKNGFLFLEPNQSKNIENSCKDKVFFKLFSKNPCIIDILLPASKEHPTLFTSLILKGSQDCGKDFSILFNSFSITSSASFTLSAKFIDSSLIHLLNITEFKLSLLPDGHSYSGGGGVNGNAHYWEMLRSLIPLIKDESKPFKTKILLELQSISLIFPFKFHLYNLIDHITLMVKAFKKKEFIHRTKDYRQDFLPFKEGDSWIIQLKVYNGIKFEIMDDPLESLIIRQHSFLPKRIELQEEFDRRLNIMKMDGNDGNESMLKEKLFNAILLSFRNHLSIRHPKDPLLGIIGSKIDFTLQYDGSWMNIFNGGDGGGGCIISDYDGGDDDDDINCKDINNKKIFQKGMMTLLNAIEGGNNFTSEGIELLSLLLGGYVTLAIDDFSLLIRDSLLHEYGALSGMKVRSGKIEVKGFLFCLEEGSPSPLSSLQSIIIPLDSVPYDNFYHLTKEHSFIQCHRTTLPLKFFHSLHVKIPQPLSIVLDLSVEDSFVQIDDCFDLFSRPSTVRLPWWDKIRLLIHGSIGSLGIEGKISFLIGRKSKGECLHIDVLNGLRMCGGGDGNLDVLGGMMIYGRSSLLPDYLQCYHGEEKILLQDLKTFHQKDPLNFFPLFSLPEIRLKPIITILGRGGNLPISHSLISKTMLDPYADFKSHSISISLGIESKSSNDELSWYYGAPTNRFMGRILFREAFFITKSSKTKTLSSVIDEFHLSLKYNGTFTIRTLMFPTFFSDSHADADAPNGSTDDDYAKKKPTSTTTIGTILRSTGSSIINLCWKTIEESGIFTLLYKEYSFSSLSINLIKEKATSTSSTSNLKRPLPVAPLEEELMEYLGFNEQMENENHLEILEFITAPNAFWIGAQIGYCYGRYSDDDDDNDSDSDVSTKEKVENMAMKCLKKFIEKRFSELEDEITFLSHSLSLVDPTDHSGDFILIKRELSVLLQKQRSLKTLTKNRNSGEIGELLINGSRLLWHQTNRNLIFLLIREWEEELERWGVVGESMNAFIKGIIKEISRENNFSPKNSLPSSPIVDHSSTGLDPSSWGDTSSCIIAGSEDGDGDVDGKTLKSPFEEPLPFLKSQHFSSHLLGLSSSIERSILFSLLIKDCQFVLFDQEIISTSLLIITSPLVEIEYSSYVSTQDALALVLPLPLSLSQQQQPHQDDDHQKDSQQQKIGTRSIAFIKDNRLFRKEINDDWHISSSNGGPSSIPWYPLDSSEKISSKNVDDFQELSEGFDLEISFTTTKNITSNIKNLQEQDIFLLGSHVNFRLPRKDHRISFRLQKEAFHDLFSMISNLFLIRDPSLENRRLQEEEALVLGKYLSSTVPIHQSMGSDIIVSFTRLQKRIRESLLRGTSNRFLEEEGRILLKTLALIPLSSNIRRKESLLRVILPIPLLSITLEPDIAQIRLVDLHLVIQKKDSMQQLMIDVVGLEMENLLEKNSESTFKEVITRLPLDEQLRRGMSLQRGWAGTLSRLKRGFYTKDTAANTSTATSTAKSHEQMNLTFNLRDLGAVGGIRVIEQLELTMSPLHLRITREIVDELFVFFFPSDKELATASPAPSAPMLKRSNTNSLTSGGGGGSFLRRNDSIRDMSLVMNEVLSRRERGSKYSSFIYVMIPSTQHLISYRSGKGGNGSGSVSGGSGSGSGSGKKKSAIMDLDHFRVRMPNFEYHSKIWSWFEFWQQIKKDSIGAMANNIGHLMKDKLFSSPNSYSKSQLSNSDSTNNLSGVGAGGSTDGTNNFSIINSEEDLKEKRKKRASLLLGEYYQK